MQIGNGQFLHGDCLELMRDLPDGSVDMVLCDLPYGTTACSWDSVIPFDALWEQYWRVCKPNAAVVLTASQPFTTSLIGSNMRDFRYSWVWEKTNATGHLTAKKMPMKAHEDIPVFYRLSPTYNPQKTKGHARVRKSSTKNRDNEYLGVTIPTHSYDSTERYPRSIQVFASDKKTSSLHPTQKPVALFEYLIRTYTNPGDLVLDNTAGSGTTAIAAENAGRRWICMERDPDYYAAAVGRVYDHAA